MLKRWRARILWCGVGALAASLAACGQKAEQGAAPSVEQKTFSLSPASASVKAAFLMGELQDMKVSEQVEGGTGKMVAPPKLQATLKLKNTSGDQTVRLVAGRVEYQDAKGKPISLVRKDTGFKFSGYQTERLDPDMEVSQSIEVPFQTAAVTEKSLQNIRLELAYIPEPYKTQTVDVRTSLGK